MDSDTPKLNKTIVGLVIIVLLAGVTTTVLVLDGDKKTAADIIASGTSSSKTAEASPVSSSNGTYKDGDYSASGSYRTPGGTEQVTVKVTLASGVINAVDFQANPTTSEAEEYQDRFVSGYKNLVIGKKIDDVSLSRVAGSSLTPAGFNAALDTIKNDARA